MLISPTVVSWIVSVPCSGGSAVRICPIYATAEDPAAAQFNVEFRVADAAASPYLALGVLVWAGLDGLRRRHRLRHVPNLRRSER